MQVRIFDKPELACRAAAVMLEAQLLAKPDSVLGLATGSSPVPVYDALSEGYAAGLLDFSRVTTFNLDEYVGLGPDHPQSYWHFMWAHLFSRVNICPEATHIPDGCAEDLEAEAAAYEATIRINGNLDVQILGIGRNGHIGFNEPGDHFIDRCHVVELAQNTIAANARFFASEAEVPRRAISMGVGSIMGAKQVLLIATGESKADAIARTVHGEVTPRVPASILQTHPNAILLLDRAAAAGL